MKLINKVYQVPVRELSEVEIKNKTELIKQSEIRKEKSKIQDKNNRWNLYNRYIKKTTK